MTRRLVTVSFYLAITVFLVWFIQRLNFAILQPQRPGWVALSAATICGLMFRYSGVAAWLLILRGLGAARPINLAELVYVYAKSWLGRYLPGKVTWILGKIYFASELGLDRAKLAVASFYEAALQVAVVLFLSLVLLAIDPRLNVLAPGSRVILLGVSVLLLIAIWPGVFNRSAEWIYRRMQRGGAAVLAARLDPTTLLSAGSVNALGFVLSGAGYFFLAKAIYPNLGMQHIIFVAGAFNLAGAIGILSVFAPSGIGVREAIQLILLPVVMPAEMALVVTVAARFWSLAVDGVFFAISWLARLAGKRASGIRSPGP